MRIQDDILIADAGKILTNGEARSKKVCLSKFDIIENWIEEPMNHEELAEEQKENKRLLIRYADRVSELIREKYSLDDELALSRQRDTKPEEFEIYFTYCEECKVRAKSEMEGITK